MTAETIVGYIAFTKMTAETIEQGGYFITRDLFDEGRSRSIPFADTIEGAIKKLEGSGTLKKLEGSGTLEDLPDDYMVLEVKLTAAHFIKAFLEGNVERTWYYQGSELAGWRYLADLHVLDRNLVMEHCWIRVR